MFSDYFCLIMEGAGSGSVQITMDPDPEGSKTYGSGSRSIKLDATMTYSFTLFQAFDKILRIRSRIQSRS